MKKQKQKYDLTRFLCGGACALLALGSVSGCLSENTTADYLIQDADAYRGGAMWDAWWEATGVKEGIEPGAAGSTLVADNPLYATNPNGNARTGKDTWRCKECHGWDYKGVDGAYASGSHATGFSGVLASQDKDPQELFDALRTGHDGLFADVFSDADVADFVEFIRTGIADDDTWIDASTKASLGDAAAGAPLFADSCANCHGADGTAFNFSGDDLDPEYLGHVATDNPWEAFHMIRFGEPDGSMPNGAVKGYLYKDAADVLAYAQTRPKVPVEAGDIHRGGRLWDEWWGVKGVFEGLEPGATGSSLPTDNPLFATNTAGSTRTGGDTWRCKECHGWDYKGKDGAYATGSHASGFPGVLAIRTKTEAELADAIANGTSTMAASVLVGHQFGKVLSPADIGDLVKFIRDGMVDDTPWINADKTLNGDLAVGGTLYAATCVACHGTDGKKINFHGGRYTSEYVFDVANGNPWELFHKIRSGQPGTAMPNEADKGYTLDDVASIVEYAQSLATPGLIEASALRGGVLWDEWWAENGVAKPTTSNPYYIANAQKLDTDGVTLIPQTRTGADTWRCKECHGWDYNGVNGAYGKGSHRTGFIGVWGATGYTAAQLISAIGDGVMVDSSVIPDHDYVAKGYLSAGDVKDLALFIREGLQDDTAIIDYGTGKSFGNPIAGGARFAANCATCHGSDGMRVNFKHDDPGPEAEYVADVAGNPQELSHKIRFGQPGSDDEAAEMLADMGLVTGHMPNGSDAGYDEQDVADIVAFSATLPGSVQRGGQAWDKWWDIDVLDPTKPTTTNPYYVSNALKDDGVTPQDRTGADTWRCKECHGWDGKGVGGAYATGSHHTGFAGVRGTTMTDAQLMAVITDGTGVGGGMSPADHSFGALIGEPIIRDLVNYIQQIPDFDVEVLALPPSVAQGRIKFESNCATCHGTDGRKINFHAGSGAEYVGTLANDNQYELGHKIFYGQPGSSPRMPNAAGAGYSFQDVRDLLEYTKLLPE